MNPKGKVALITGGAHRVGKAITLMLAQSGIHVVINYNSSDSAAKETEAEATALGVDAMAVQCDVAKLDSVRRMATAIEDRFGGVDIIVNGASLFGRFGFPTDDPNDLDVWTRVTDISINGPFYVCNTLAPLLIKRARVAGEAGAIVNIVDLSVWQPWSNFTAHAVGKSGLLALTRQLALELAPDVRVNAVAPGLVLPPSNASKQRVAALAERNLLKRWGSAKDVAQAVKFLIEADFVTGETIKVDGGEYIASGTEG